MLAPVEQIRIENELAAIRLQEEELQTQQDALVAQRLAIAFSLGFDLEDENTLESAIQKLGLDIPGITDIRQLEGQLHELRANAGFIMAESLQESFLEHAQVERESEAVAAALQAQERWRAAVARHDETFARRLVSLDEKTWAEKGDIIEEPLNLPMPVCPPTIPPDSSDCSAASASGSRHPTPPLAGMTAPTLTPNAGPTTQGPTTARPPSVSAPSSGSGVPSSTPTSRGPGPSDGAAPGGSAAQPQGGTNPVEDSCLSCFDRFIKDKLTCAGADAASSSTVPAGCGHYFCSGCITEYVRGAIKDGKYPITCPMAVARGGGGGGRQGCRLKFSREAVLAVLEGQPREILQAFHVLEAKSTLDLSKLLYCPHKSCSSPLQVDLKELPPNQPSICPACRNGFCPRCRIPGWHKGYTCSEFQALPAHLRSAEDAALLQLSAKQQWKQCPQCQQMVERSEGCNHMLCRCGCNFCYGCGKPYKDNKPTPNNEHGTPACGCRLFDIPADVNDRLDNINPLGDSDDHDDDDDDESMEKPEVQHAPALGLRVIAFGGGLVGPHIEMYEGHRPRRWRGGRLVSHTRCRYSASIHDCPQGPDRCWFWHDEDDERTA